MPRSLWPREHGAYVQLAAPLATALMLRVPTPAAALFAVAACLAFLANEPLLVVLGHRGARAKESDGKRAAWRLAFLSILAAIAGCVAILIAPRAARIAAGGAAALGALLVGVGWRRAQHSLHGELVAAAGLPAAGLPIATASGFAWQHATEIWSAWAIGYSLCVLAVHRVLGRNRGTWSWVDAAVGTTAALATATSLAARNTMHFAPMAVPLGAIATTLVILRPHARHVRRVGVAIVIASVASILFAVSVP